MTETFHEVMRRQGITRRSFLKYCSLTAAALGLGPAFVPRIAHAMETKPRIPVNWLHGLECICCSESFIRSAHPLAKDVVLSMVSLDYDDTIMAAAGHQAEAIIQETIDQYDGNYKVDLMAVAHYLEALDIQKDFVQVHTVFGGKNPHPNYLVGGVPCAINMDGALSAGAPLNMERLNFVKARIDEMKTFCDNVYIPDVLGIASFYKTWLYGGGLGAKTSWTTGPIRRSTTTSPPTSCPVG